MAEIYRRRKGYFVSGETMKRRHYEAKGVSWPIGHNRQQITLGMLST